MSILVIEDDAHFVELLNFWLSPRKIRVAHTLKEAQQMIAEELPKVLVVDLKLPDSSAAQTVARLEELKKESGDATVIVISGCFDDQPIPGATQCIDKNRAGFFAELDQALVEHLDRLRPKGEVGKAITNVIRKLTGPPC